MTGYSSRGEQRISGDVESKASSKGIGLINPISRIPENTASDTSDRKYIWDNFLRREMCKLEQKLLKLGKERNPREF